MKDPAFLFYSDNFMSGTMFLSDEQVGKYIRLLCAQHLTGHLSENDMIFICKQYDENIFKKFSKDEQGKYYNERLEAEILKRQNYSKSRSDNKLGKTKKNKIISKSYDKHMGNENGNEIYNVLLKKVIAENEILLPEGFESLILEWLKYKSEKKQSYKETGLKAFIKTFLKDANSDEKIGRAMLDNSMSKNYDGLFALKQSIQIPIQKEEKILKIHQPIERN